MILPPLGRFAKGLIIIDSQQTVRMSCAGANHHLSEQNSRPPAGNPAKF
jgi:hypothetical protein